VFPAICLSRVSGPAFCLSVVFAALLGVGGIAPQASAQATTVAPQLLPYTSKLIAGGGSTTATKGSVCSRAGATPSGYTSYDAYGDGCLATEIAVANPRGAVADASGAVYYTDYNSSNVGLVHRIDPVTGIVTAVAGGGANPAAGAACSTVNAADPNTAAASDVFGDGCLAASVKLARPAALAFSPSGDLYISDSYNYNVRKMSMSNGGVAAVAITYGGTNYATAPTVTFSAPASGGTTATGTAVINGSGSVTSVTITSAGSGYTSAPTVTFSVAPTGDSTATGIAVYSGVISAAIGEYDDSSASSKGFTAGAAGCNLLSTSTTTGCLLYDPYGIAVDGTGDLLIADAYYDVLVAANPTSGSNNVGDTAVAAGSEATIMGARTGGTPCLRGTGSTTSGNSGCNYGNYNNGVVATASQLDAPQGVAVDSTGNVYVADQEDNSVAIINPSTGIVNNFAGAYPLLGYGTRDANNTRGLAGFSIGSTFDVATDPTNNVYITDATAGIAWRVDATTQTMYAVGGGGSPTSGSPCATSGPGASLTATDAYGDGCPALQASFSLSGTCPGSKCYASTGLYGVYADMTGDIFLGDEGNDLYREISSGTKFGNTGASQTDYLEVHFAAGDTPPSTGAYVITSGGNIFSIGAATCTMNADNNPSIANTEDCVIPVTASPTVSGPYTGTLTVYSKLVPGGTSFRLTGNFVQSPVTRVVVTSASTATSSCTSTTIYPSTTPVTLIASLTANGPSAPTGTIQFYSGSTALGSPVAVSNIGTTSAPVYGAVLTNTFSTPGAYSITAQYIPASGSYFVGSTSAASAFTSSTPTFTAAPVSYSEGTVSPGGTALYSFTVTTSVYTGTVTFKCSNLPANSSCSFSPSSITGAGCSTTSTIALSIQTQAGTTVQVAGFGGAGRGLWSIVAVFAGLFLATLLGTFRRRIPLRSGQLLLLFALLLAATGLTACGKAAGTQLTPATPAFSGNITVTATGSDSTVSSFTVPLTVR
jgi:hypothetical protein